MPVRAWVDAFTLSSGDEVKCGPDATIVVVGPNNAGKSRFLHELHGYAQNSGNIPGPVLKTATIKHEGSREEYERWLDERAERRGTTKVQDRTTGALRDTPMMWGFGHPEGLEHLLNAWDLRRDRPFVGGGLGIGPAWTVLADGASRLAAADPAGAINFVTDAPQHPIHLLWKDEKLERRLSDYFRRAFGEDLRVYRGGGSSVPLVCGQAPPTVAGEGELSLAYQRRLSVLKQLREQGDGMRSFVGSLLSVIVPSRFIAMIDEPEAFLHPPQARLLGTMLAAEKPQHLQLWVATHSGDILRGLLDAGKPLLVVRVSRTGDANRAAVLEPDDIKAVWGDSILRFSNILDGVFHERVVVCEGDADCRFYAAMVDANHAIASGGSTLRRPDLMFVASGGKERVPTVATALTRLRIPTCAVLDFDVLNAEQPLRATYEALGGTWADVEKEWRYVKQHIDQKSPPLTTAQVTQQLQAILSSVAVPNFPADATKQIRDALRAASPWAPAKLAGVGAVSGGQPMQTLQSLLAKLRATGIFVVECGQLERFAPSVDGHGPRWVAEVLTKDLTTDAELANARTFASGLAAWAPA